MSAKIGFGNLAHVAAGTFYDKYRIETGQATVIFKNETEVNQNIQVNIEKLNNLGVDVSDFMSKLDGIKDKPCITI